MRVPMVGGPLMWSKWSVELWVVPKHDGPARGPCSDGQGSIWAAMRFLCLVRSNTTGFYSGDTNATITNRQQNMLMFTRERH